MSRCLAGCHGYVYPDNVRLQLEVLLWYHDGVGGFGGFGGVGSGGDDALIWGF